jgi:hypothetical protein
MSKIHPHRSKQTDLKEAPWAVNSGLYEADAVCHFRRVRICIHTCRSCIERVANEAPHYREIRSHAASVPLRRYPIPEKCERDVASPACEHSEMLGASGQSDLAFRLWRLLLYERAPKLNFRRDILLPKNPLTALT